MRNEDEENENIIIRIINLAKKVDRHVTRVVFDRHSITCELHDLTNKKETPMKETDANVSRRIDDERKVFLISLLMMNSKNSSFLLNKEMH